MAFCPLHVHTANGSLLDGACRIDELVNKAKEYGMPAVAVTDHGTMYAAVDFYKAAKAAGIKPIIGCEVYVAPRSRTQKVHGIDNNIQHLVLLCENETGYKNLCYLVSQAYLTGFYKKPRIDKELLEAHHDGLIALSACLAGEIPRILLGTDEDPDHPKTQEGRLLAATEAAKYYANLFGEDHYYLEMQDHGIQSQMAVNRGIRKIAKNTGIPLVITNDTHYINKEDAYVQEVLMCIGTKRTISDPKHMRFETEEFYLKSEEEMRVMFPDDDEAFANTVKIADMCNFDFEFGHYHLPAFDPPAGFASDEAYFEHLCWSGYKDLYPEDRKEDRQQMEYEIQMIKKMGFVNYFLIVADYIRWAKEHDVPVGPGRGSAAGSMVSYCMHITDVDPREYSLYFERFLNPERVSMPDIDVDFCVDRRARVIDYVTERYGKDRVAQIVTFGTLKAKNAVRSVGRALDVSVAEVNKLAKMIPSDLNITIDEALQKSPDLNNAYLSDPKVKQLIDIAKRVEGLPKNTSTHAAAVVIASGPVYEFAPLSRDSNATTENALPVIQYNMTTVEEIGLLKMDFLGLRNLTVIDAAQTLIHKKDPSFDIRNIDVHDQNVFSMLSKGNTFGVFQMESAGMTGVCVDLKPQSIEDLTAIVALYRPGPMDSIPTFVNSKRHPEQVGYITPQLESILKVTYGCIVYQEQVIEIFKKLGGYSLGQADNIRRAISKKKEKTILAERETFVNGDTERNIPGAVKNGVAAEAANKIYDEIVSFASYAFNKSHAVCYAVIAYQTAFLKYYYPVEYMAALMTSVVDNPDKMTEYIVSARETGIRVLPPDVNASGSSFSVEDDAIRFPLNAIKGIGEAVIDELIETRGSGYKNFEDFMKRTNGIANKSTYEGLIYAGALDGFGLNRNQMIASFEMVSASISQQKKKNIEGQIGLFDDIEESTYTIPEIPEMLDRKKLSHEKQMLGVYISGHPFDEYAPFTKDLDSTVIINAAMEELVDGEKNRKNYRLAGIITQIDVILTKKGARMAKFVLEDEMGSITAIAFAKAFAAFEDKIVDEAAVCVTGQIFKSEGSDPVFAVSDVAQLDSVFLYENKQLFLNVPEGETRAKVLSLFDNNVGTTDVIFCEKTGEAPARVFGRGYHSINIQTARALYNMLGRDRIVLR